MKLVCDSKYIVLPCNYTAQEKRLIFQLDGKTIFDLAVELDYLNPDFYAYINIERYRGMVLEVSCNPEISFKIGKTDIIDDSTVYTEKYRPQFHFTSKRGWINDPNGLVYYKGKYHMFYQHNPAGCKWQNMHWGHAISDDLVHWTELDCALYPDEMGMMFSGSAIVDSKNVTGLKTTDEDVILLFYTAAGDSSEASKGRRYTQCLAYSVDGGNTFTKYHKNPIVPHILEANRDPKVIFYEASGNYIMALYLDKNKFALLSSKNLLDWQHIQEIAIEDEWECPDFYPLPLDGNKNKVKWVICGAFDRYIIGSFDGRTFTEETGVQRLHYGNNSYASQTWSDIDLKDGRRIRTTWNTYDIYSMPFNKSMTFPCEMTLKSTPQGMRLFAYPIKEIESLYISSDNHSNLPVKSGQKLSLPLSGKAHDIILRLSHTNGSVFNISLFGIKISCDMQSNQLKCLDSIAPITAQNGIIDLRILVDVTSIELFINGGQAFICNGFMTDYNLNRFEIEAVSSDLVAGEIKISQLKNIWHK
ncbi:MAG: glycoside hydrolase family 32 protein [Clostridia bacterium]|nr:glycoside hydrolase family 32 protein [Clostridia bacterium]